MFNFEPGFVRNFFCLYTFCFTFPAIIGMVKTIECDSKNEQGQVIFSSDRDTTEPEMRLMSSYESYLDNNDISDTPENASETSGTPGYMAPEVMCRQNHGLAADYFAVGVIAYECMQGRRPYVGRSRREIRE